MSWKETSSDLGNSVDGIGGMVSGIVKMMKKAIQAIVKIIQIIFKIVMFIVSNPLVSLIILIITLAIFFLIWWLSDKQDVNRVSHTSPPAIVLNKDEVQALGFHVDKDGRIQECKNIDVMKNPWETGIDGYDINASYDMGAKMVENYCLYTFLYAKAANGEFQISKTGSIAWTAENQSGTTMTGSTGSGGSLIISPLKSAIQKISSTGVYGIVNSHRYEDYGPKEYGNDRIRFPYSYWTGNAEKFANSFYAYQFAKDFSNDFSIKDKSGMTMSGMENKIMYSTDGSFEEIIKGRDWKDDMSLFMDRAMRNLPQGDLRSEIAGSSSYYQCIPPPCPPDAKVCPVCETPSFDDTDSRNMLTEYKMFVEALRSKNLLFLSGIVGPPFKNYKNADGKDCNVTLYLIQRDGRSDYNRAGAGGYPGGIHAGLDLPASQKCNGLFNFTDKFSTESRDVPVFAITDGEVYSIEYAPTAWGNTIIVKSTYNNEVYYIRYSHLKKRPDYVVGDLIRQGDIVGIEGMTGAAGGIHLDITINKGGLRYFDYIHNTLESGFLGNGMQFEDLFQPGTVVKTYTNKPCFDRGNCSELQNPGTQQR